MKLNSVSVSSVRLPTTSTVDQLDGDAMGPKLNRMRLVKKAVGRMALVVALGVGGVMALGGGKPAECHAGEAGACEAKRDSCRSACFDKFASKSEDAFAKCKEQCNAAWLSCSGHK